MALDTNANANMNMPTQGQQGQTPYTPMNGVAAMVKAIMDGDAASKQQQMSGGGMSPMSPGSMVPGAMGPTSTGGPMGPTPLVDPSSMTGGLGAPPPMSGGAGIPSPSPGMTQGFPTGGTSPMGMDPVTQALMSPIPGM
jgi:hypothetical protein